MGKISETTTTSECDVCGLKESITGFGLPDGWYEIAIGLKYEGGKSELDWPNCWKGVVCKNCYAGTQKYPSITSELTAKPLLQKIFNKLKSTGGRG